MDWTIKQLSNFKSEILSMKENYIGEKINNDLTITGAGKKCIKLTNVENKDSFISYEDVLEEGTPEAKEVFNYFFKEETVENDDDSSSENTTTESSTIEIIPITGDDIEDEIEQYLITQTGNDDLMAYEGFNISEKAFRSREEQDNYIKENCLVFADGSKYYYIVQDDGTGDYTIEKRKKDGFNF